MIVVESVCLLFCSVSYYTVRVYWCEVARSHVYRLVSTAARVSSTRSRHISCGAARVLLPRGVSPTRPPLLTSVHSLKGRVGGISPGARAVPSSRRAQPFAPLAASLAAPLFLGFGDAVLAARAAQAPCALSPVLALLPRPAALPPAAAFLPLGLVTGPGAHAKTGRIASSSGFLAPWAS